MSATIDERIVEMRFDNKQFEENVQTSMNTLDKLKQSLDLDGAAKGLNNIGEAARRFDLSQLGSSVETVRGKFSALEVMAVTALSNITNSAVNAGRRLVSAFTIEPIKSGFDEYELKMGSIQTIMASTGESLDHVNEKLNELNLYSDKTIYSFSDMTTNIGKFTNAGVKLDDAVAAIQGVSNVAAVSGANANEASRAMYNFAQALSAGHVKLIDWKSIENANMATVEFKTQLLESAVAAKTVKKTADGMYKVLSTNSKGKTMGESISATQLFNDSLSYQWMTTEVLTETLKKYADENTEIGKKAFAAAQDVKTFSQMMDTLKESAQSGWAETWQLFAGDFEEAKATFTEFSNFFGDIINQSAEERNSLLGGALTSSWGQLKERVSETGFAVDDFKTVLRETASESVDGLDKMIEEAGSFDATLSKGWLTTDILAETLDKMANKATGATDGIASLSDEQLISVGYTEEQIQSMRELAQQASAASGPVVDLVNNMTRESGRELVFDSLLNAAKAVQKVFGTLKGAWNDIFPPATSEQLYGAINVLHEFSKKLILSDETADKIGRTFKGLFATLDIVKQAFSAVFQSIAPLFGGFGTLGGTILGASASVGDWIVSIDEAIRKNNTFTKAIQSVDDFISGGIQTVKEFASAIREKFDLPTLDQLKESAKGLFSSFQEKVQTPGLELIHNFLERIRERLSQVLDAFGSLKSGAFTAIDSIGNALQKSNFLQLLQALWNGAKKLIGGIVSAVGDLAGSIIEKLGNADFRGAIDLLNGISFAGIALGIKKFLESIEEPLEDLGSLKESVVGILDSVKGCFEAYQTQLKANVLLKIAAAIAILAAAIIAMSFVDSDKLSASLGGITVLFADLIGTMALFEKIGGSGKELSKSSTNLIKMAAAVLVLTTALKKISELNMDQLGVGLTGISVLMAELVAASKIIGSGSGGMTKGAGQMLIMAAAVKVLASACMDLSVLEWDELGKGLAGVGGLLAEVDIFLNTAKFNGKSITTAIGIVVLSGAIKILVSVCEDFKQMKWEEIGKGLAGIGGLLLELAAFTKLTGDAKHVISTGIALIEIGAAMKIFASAMADFKQMTWEEISRGLTAMALSLAEVTIAVNLMPSNLIGIGTGLVIVGGALEILANVLNKMGQLTWDEIGVGLTAMGGALLELSIGLNVMQGTLGGAAALLVASVALGALTPVLSSLGKMSWESVAKGLIAIAGAFTVIGIAGAVLGPLVPVIAGLAGSFALIGVGVLGIGAGLLMAGTGLTAMATGITALSLALSGGTTVIVAGLTAIITGIAALIPAVAVKIGEGIVAICGVIAESAPAIGEAIKAIILSFLDVIGECAPDIVDTAFLLLTTVLESLVQYTPQIVDSLLEFLIEVLDGVSEKLPTLIQSAVNLVMAFFSGITDALEGIDTGVLLKGVVGIGLLSALMMELAGIAALAPGAMLGILEMGILIAELTAIVAAIGILEQIPGLNWLVGEGGKLLEQLGTALGSFVGGIAGGFMEGVSSKFPQIGSDLSDFMTNAQTFIEGASSITPDMLDGVTALSEAILVLTASDILSGLASWLTGDSSLSDFAKQLIPFGDVLKEYSESVSDIDADSITNSAAAGKALAEMAASIPNSGGILGFFAGENDMESFGNQLSKFGRAIRNFSSEIVGIDNDAITNAAAAGKIMAEMASSIPNSGGVLGFFAGENDMESFGNQLEQFGTAVKGYSLAVKGLDVDAITNSATAGKVMTDLARTIPNTGGLISFFTGENDINSFGSKLKSFGTALNIYSYSVKDLDSTAISDSVVAAKSLVELADVIPNVGGLVSFITGDNDISNFGNSLVEFGKSLASYSDSVRLVKAESVTASANAARALSNLANGLPSMDAFSKLSTEKQTLTSFGKDIAGFGESMKKYYSSISGADSTKLSNAISQIRELSNLAKELQNFNGNGFDKFSKSLKTLADIGIDEFASTFKNSSQKIEPAVSTMLKQVSSSISKNQPVPVASMKNLVDELVKSFGDRTTDFVSTVSQITSQIDSVVNTDGQTIEATTVGILERVLQAIKDRKNDFLNAAKELSQSLIDGIKGNTQIAVSAASQLGADVINAARVKLEISGTRSNAFYLMGRYVSNGLARGITDNSSAATTASKTLTNSVVVAAKQAAKINSPSKVMKNEVGYNLSEGVAEGIENNSSPINAARQMSQDISATMKEGLSQDYAYNTDPFTASRVALLTTAEQTGQSAAASYQTGFTQGLDANDDPFSAVTPDILVFAEEEGEEVAKKAQLGYTNGMTDYIAEDQTSIWRVANAPPEFVDWINSRTEAAAEEAIQTVENVFSSYTPSEEYEYLGKVIGDSFTIGLNNAISPVSEVTSTMMKEIEMIADQGIETFENWLEDKKYYGQISLKEELAGWEFVQAKYKEGSEERKKADREVYRVQNELVSATYQASENWIEEEKYYKKLSLAEELAAWERVQARYLEGSEERKKADKEVYRVRNELAASSYQFSLNWIEEEKYYKRLSLEEELAAWERVQARYLEGSEERKKADKEIYRVRNELAANSYQFSMDWIEEEKYYGRMSLSDELAAYLRVQKRYAKGTEERKKMDREVYRLIKEIAEAEKQYTADVDRVKTESAQKRLELEQEYADEVSEINRRLEEDIKSVNDEYESALKSRADTLYRSYGLFDEISEKDPVSGTTLMKNLEGQVKEFESWQDELNSLSARGLSSELIEELQEMGPSAIAEIKALNSLTDRQLEKYASLWSVKHALAREQALTELDGLRNDTQSRIETLRLDADAELEECRKNWVSKLQELSSETNSELEELRKTFNEKVGTIKTDTETELTEMTENAQKILREAGWSESGERIVTELKEGAEKAEPELIKTFENMAAAALNVVANVWDSHSPSGKFWKLGNYAGMGVVGGLLDYTGKSYHAASELGESAKAGLENAISGIASVINNDIDTEPVIRPVLDLSDIINGTNTLNSIFSSNTPFNIAIQNGTKLQALSSGNSGIVAVGNNADVVKELKELRSDISLLSNNMEKMKVVLDTGTLVGEMTGPMDAALGREAVYKGRGI